jgi:hypothetical protein
LSRTLDRDKSSWLDYSKIEQGVVVVYCWAARFLYRPVARHGNGALCALQLVWSCTWVYYWLNMLVCTPFGSLIWSDYWPSSAPCMHATGQRLTGGGTVPRQYWKFVQYQVGSLDGSAKQHCSSLRKKQRVYMWGTVGGAWEQLSKLLQLWIPVYYCSPKLLPEVIYYILKAIYEGLK